MIRFVDLSEDYWTYWVDSSTGHPVCAFLSTSSDRFLEVDGCHVFNSLDEIQEHPQSVRMLALLPEGFFEQVRGGSGE